MPLNVGNEILQSQYISMCVCVCVYARAEPIKFVRFEVFLAVTMKNAVCWDIKTQFVSRESHYFSTTEPSRLMLCNISGFHCSDYEECRLLTWDAVWLLLQPTFQRNVLPPSSGPKESAS
jgi:hypothetical protein